MKNRRFGIWAGGNDGKRGLFFSEDPLMDGIAWFLLLLASASFLTGLAIGLSIGKHFLRP